MQPVKNQAYRYAHGLLGEEGWPPFLMAVDVGHCVDLHVDFARQGKNYVPFPDANSHRLFLEDPRDEAVRALMTHADEPPNRSPSISTRPSVGRARPAANTGPRTADRKACGGTAVDP